MLPEEKVRLEINQKLNDTEWLIADRKNYSLVVSAVAISEGILIGDIKADYLLFEGEAIGVLEAKKNRHNLIQCGHKTS